MELSNTCDHPYSGILIIDFASIVDDVKLHHSQISELAVPCAEWLGKELKPLFSWCLWIWCRDIPPTCLQFFLHAKGRKGEKNVISFLPIVWYVHTPVAPVTNCYFLQNHHHHWRLAEQLGERTAHRCIFPRTIQYSTVFCFSVIHKFDISSRIYLMSMAIFMGWLKHLITPGCQESTHLTGCGVRSCTFGVSTYWWNYKHWLGKNCKSTLKRLSGLLCIVRCLISTSANVQWGMKGLVFRITYWGWISPPCLCSVLYDGHRFLYNIHLLHNFMDQMLGGKYY